MDTDESFMVKAIQGYVMAKKILGDLPQGRFKASRNSIDGVMSDAISIKGDAHTISELQ